MSSGCRSLHGSLTGVPELHIDTRLSVVAANGVSLAEFFDR
jgi:hypothetical protein